MNRPKVGTSQMRATMIRPTWTTPPPARLTMREAAPRRGAPDTRSTVVARGVVAVFVAVSLIARAPPHSRLLLAEPPDVEHHRGQHEEEQHHRDRAAKTLVVAAPE